MSSFVTNMNNKTHSDFSNEVLRRRAEYQRMRDESNLFPPVGKPVLDQKREIVEGRPAVVRWYETESTSAKTPSVQCIRIVDVPGTFSGELLRLRRNLPKIQGNVEFFGDDVRDLDVLIPLPDEENLEEDVDDTDDISAELKLLPLVVIDKSKHAVKKCKYRSEIYNLLKCQGGKCPGSPLSQHIVQLLGKSKKDELVFEKLMPRAHILGRFCSLAIYKNWILQLIEALSALHGLGIVHRDLRVDNIVFSEDGQRLVVCDLETHWGMRSAPEIPLDGGLDNFWTEKTDIFDVGLCIKSFVYANHPITEQVEWPVPSPLDTIVKACTHTTPHQRPSLHELRAMVEKIEV